MKFVKYYELLYYVINKLNNLEQNYSHSRNSNIYLYVYKQRLIKRNSCIKLIITVNNINDNQYLMYDCTPIFFIIILLALVFKLLN